MKNNIVYWIWLQQVLGFGSHKVRTVRLLFNNIEDFYSAGETEWRMCGCFTTHEIELLRRTPASISEKIFYECNNLKIKMIAIDDERYPERLKNIVNPPCVLYYKGNFPEVDRKLCISIVGTRNATSYGERMTYDIAYNLAKNNAVIVSGGALGIDSAAHRGAIQAGGETLAILGCGLNFPYLYSNLNLRNLISKHGALISEYPPNYPVYKRNFLVRNRIISGLSLGTLVVEAGEKSGSLITANLSADQNRDVFVVPVDMRSPVSIGSFNLIRDGAKIVTKGEDILEEYRHLNFSSEEKIVNFQKNNYFKSKHIDDNFGNIDKISKDNKEKIVQKHISILEEVSENSKKIYKLLRKEKMHIDEISLKVELEMNEVMSALTELEILGLIKSYPGKFYSECD